MGVPAEDVRAAARLYATGGNAAIYYGLGVTEHSQGSTMVMGMANIAMATGNIGKPGSGVNPLRGQNNVQGSCDMGSFPHEFSGYRHVSDDTVRGQFENLWQVPILPEPGLRSLRGNQKLDTIKVTETKDGETIALTLSPYNRDDDAMDRFVEEVRKHRPEVIAAVELDTLKI